MGFSACIAVDRLDQGDCCLSMLSCHHDSHLVAVYLAVPLTSILLYLVIKLFPQVPREAAEEAKEAVAAPAAAAAGGGDGLDMFADNIDADMFAEDPVAPVGIAPAKKALLDNYDDVEGYYNFQVAVCDESCIGLRLYAAPSAHTLLQFGAVSTHVARN